MCVCVCARAQQAREALIKTINSGGGALCRTARGSRSILTLLIPPVARGDVSGVTANLIKCLLSLNAEVKGKKERKEVQEEEGGALPVLERLKAITRFSKVALRC